MTLKPFLKRLKEKSVDNVWDIIKSLIGGLILKTLLGIYGFLKEDAIFKAAMTQKMFLHDSTLANHASGIAKRQEYEHQKDQEDGGRDSKITFLYGTLKKEYPK